MCQALEVSNQARCYLIFGGHSIYNPPFGGGGYSGILTHEVHYEGLCSTPKTLARWAIPFALQFPTTQLTTQLTRVGRLEVDDSIGVDVNGPRWKGPTPFPATSIPPTHPRPGGRVCFVARPRPKFTGSGTPNPRSVPSARKKNSSFQLSCLKAPTSALVIKNGRRKHFFQIKNIMKMGPHCPYAFFPSKGDWTVSVRFSVARTHGNLATQLLLLWWTGKKSQPGRRLVDVKKKRYLYLEIKLIANGFEIGDTVVKFYGIPFYIELLSS